MGVGAFSVLTGGCLIGQVWSDGFVVMALALGFHGIKVWACGLGGGGGEKAPDFILSLNSGKNLYFFRSILPLANTSSNGGCDVSSFLTFLFSWPRLGLWCSEC